MASPTYGGQAVIEGVLMRGPQRWAVACRRTDGTIALRAGELKARIYTSPLWAKPGLRAFALLAETLHLGLAQMRWAANLQLEGKSSRQMSSRSLGITVAFSAAFSIVLFILLPHWLSATGSHFSSLAPTWLEAPLRLAIAFGYLAIISLLPQVQTLWRYHGAEHKAINALESGLPLTVANVRASSRFHPRCGTGFFVLVLLLASIVFLALTPLHLSFLTAVAARILITPLLISASYEVLRFLAAHRTLPLATPLLTVMLSAQRLTTREPQDAQIECAIAALGAVLEPQAALASQTALLPSQGPLTTPAAQPAV